MVFWGIVDGDQQQLQCPGNKARTLFFWYAIILFLYTSSNIILLPLSTQHHQGFLSSIGNSSNRSNTRQWQCSSTRKQSSYPLLTPTYGLKGAWFLSFFITVTILILFFIHSLVVPCHFPLQLPRLMQYSSRSVDASRPSLLLVVYESSGNSLTWEYLDGGTRRYVLSFLSVI